MRVVSLVWIFVAACSPPGSIDEEGQSLAAPPRSRLEFQVGFTQVQRGAVVRGGDVDVGYARGRMGSCADATIFQYARFSPGGQTFSSEQAFGFDVPADAKRVDLWF